MAVNFSIDITTEDGRNVEALQQLIRLRGRELGNTTKQSLIATAVEGLKSLRADTKVAVETKANIKIEDMSKHYIPYYKREKGKKGRVSRGLKDADTGNVAVFEKIKVCWNFNDFTKAKAYGVTDIVSDTKKVQYFIVTENEQKAKDFAMEFHKNRVKVFKGLAKLALSISTFMLNQEGEIEPTYVKTYNTAKNNAEVEVYEGGFDSGEVAIKIHDKLNYSADALKSGSGYVDIAFLKAMNKAVGYVIHKMKQNGTFDDSFDVPFPDIKVRK